MNNPPFLTLVGAGSIGSIAAQELSLMGRTIPLRMILCDFDAVSGHNPTNQLYRSTDIGRKKVEALKEILGEFSNLEIKTRDEEINEESPISGIVIVAVDSMVARRKIFSAVRFNATVPLYLEARSGGEFATVYAFDPRDADDVVKYEKTLYGDEEAAAAPCADPWTIPTLLAIASVVGRILALFLREGLIHASETLINYDRYPTIQTRTL